jgi:hypothetical protein
MVMSMEMISKYHEFQCQVCMQMIKLNKATSNEDKISKLIFHQNHDHLVDFTNSGLSDEQRMVYYTGNQVYVDGKPETEFQS